MHESGVVENESVDLLVRQLGDDGFAWTRGSGMGSDEALELARSLIEVRCALDGVAAPELVADYVLPPADAGPSRDFQTLHFDFGVPLDPRLEHDVGLYTALHIPTGFGEVSAVTRLVPLGLLLAQRTWPPDCELLGRLVAYGESHGAWDHEQGYVEGSLARIVEAAAGAPALPSVKADPSFLCGMEFHNLESELRFFEHHGLRVDPVQIEVPLLPGELLVFDNLAVAHGRRGARRPGELRQWVFGEERVSPARSAEVRSRVLAAFQPGAPVDQAAASIP
jgi:hypothetical protein